MSHDRARLPSAGLPDPPATARVGTGVWRLALRVELGAGAAVAGLPDRQDQTQLSVALTGVHRAQSGPGDGLARGAAPPDHLQGAWAGRQVVAVDPFYPSSKTCSNCAAVNTALKWEKHWVCPACGAHHDRDVNAAKNLRAEGLRMLADLSPATAERAGSDARGMVSAAEAAERATVHPPQRRPTMNRESAQRSAQAARPARTETRQALSGTARRRVRAGLKNRPASSSLYRRCTVSWHTRPQPVPVQGVIPASVSASVMLTVRIRYTRDGPAPSRARRTRPGRAPWSPWATRRTTPYTPITLL